MKWWLRHQFSMHIAICVVIDVALDLAAFNDGRTLDSPSTAAAIPTHPSSDRETPG